MQGPGNETSPNRLILKLALIATLMACVACSRVEQYDDGQGFRLVKYHAREVIPFLFGVGTTADALRMRTRWYWQELARGQMGVRSMDGGMFVVIEAEKGLEWRIYRAGKADSARLQIGDCGGQVIRTRDRRGLQCIVIFGKERYDIGYQNRFKRQDGPSTAMVTRFDMDGHIVEVRKADVPVPIPGGWCDGGYENGQSTVNDEVVVVVNCDNPDPNHRSYQESNFRYAVMPGEVRRVAWDEQVETDEDRNDEFDRQIR
jgi:hypothetical protein